MRKSTFFCKFDLVPPCKEKKVGSNSMQCTSHNYDSKISSAVLQNFSHSESHRIASQLVHMDQFSNAINCCYCFALHSRNKLRLVVQNEGLLAERQKKLIGLQLHWTRRQGTTILGLAPWKPVKHDSPDLVRFSIINDAWNIYPELI